MVDEDMLSKRRMDTFEGGESERICYAALMVRHAKQLGMISRDVVVSTSDELRRDGA